MGRVVGSIITLLALLIILKKTSISWWGAPISVLNVYVAMKPSGDPQRLVILQSMSLANLISTVIIALGFARTFGVPSVFAIVPP